MIITLDGNDSSKTEVELDGRRIEHLFKEIRIHSRAGARDSVDLVSYPLHIASRTGKLDELCEIADLIAGIYGASSAVSVVCE